MEELLSLKFNFLGVNVALTPLHAFLFISNIILFFLAGPIVKTINFDPKKHQTKLWTFRFFNIAFLVLHIIDFVLIDLDVGYTKQFSKMALCLISIYTVKLIHHVIEHFIKMKFGQSKEIDGKSLNVDSYSSRVVQLIVTTFLYFFNLIVIIQILGYKSLLETTGLIGIVLGFLALTSAIWAPDIFHGLALLNSNMISDGDLIELDDEPYLVFKTSLLETTLLNIKNNHRSRIRNSILSSNRIDNLTKLADAQGVRETLHYKIGYPKNSDEFDKLQKNVREMFDEAFKQCCDCEDILLNNMSSPEIFLIETGDHALHYSFSFYLSKIKNTKITKEARAFLRTRYLVNEEVFKASIQHGIDLATPITISNKG